MQTVFAAVTFCLQPPSSKVMLNPSVGGVKAGLWYETSDCSTFANAAISARNGAIKKVRRDTLVEAGVRGEPNGGDVRTRRPYVHRPESSASVQRPRPSGARPRQSWWNAQQHPLRPDPWSLRLAVATTTTGRASKLASRLAAAATVAASCPFMSQLPRPIKRSPSMTGCHGSRSQPMPVRCRGL